MLTETPLSVDQHITQVGLPKPTALWLGYLMPELLLPFIIAGAHYKWLMNRVADTRRSLTSARALRADHHNQNSPPVTTVVRYPFFTLF